MSTIPSIGDSVVPYSDLGTGDREDPSWERVSRAALYGFSFVAACAFFPAALAKKKRAYSSVLAPASAPAPTVIEAAVPAAPPRLSQIPALERAPRCSEEDAASIREIFTTSADNGWVGLVLKKGRLESLGEGLKKRNVHPFEILRHMPRKAIQKIFQEEGLIARRKITALMEGIQEGMERESANLGRYAPGLAADMGKSSEKLMQLIQARDWRGVVVYLYDINGARGG